MEDNTKTRAESVRGLKRACQRVLEAISLHAPLGVVREMWKGVMEHGSNLFGEHVYTVGDEPALGDHEENEIIP